MNRVLGLLKIAGWILLVLIVLVLVVAPAATTIAVNYGGGLPLGSSKYLGYLEHIQRFLMQVLAGLWFFVLGACFASFLNVVAYRVPRSRSVLGSSHCPQCNMKLSFRDNFPIIGWLRNEGKCSGCAKAISSRYLWVEVILGTVFLVLSLSTLASGGMTLPFREPTGMGFERVLFDPDWELIGILSWQLVLVMSLFTVSLIQADRLDIPSMICWPIVVGALMTVSLYSPLQIVPPCWPFADWFPLLNA